MNKTFAILLLAMTKHRVAGGAEALGQPGILACSLRFRIRIVQVAVLLGPPISSGILKLDMSGHGMFVGLFFNLACSHGTLIC